MEMCNLIAMDNCHRQRLRKPVDVKYYLKYYAQIILCTNVQRCAKIFLKSKFNTILYYINTVLFSFHFLTHK